MRIGPLPMGGVVRAAPSQFVLRSASVNLIVRS